MSDSPRVLVFTATYNERDNIEEFCRQVLTLNEGRRDESYDLLVVDDSSPDDTGRRLDRIAQQDPRVRVIHRPRKLGLGSAHKLAMIHAIQHGYDRLVTMDADFSHDPAAIPELLDCLDGADFATGSRYAPGGRCDYRGYRRFISLAANLAARRLLGIDLHEFTTSFRAFRVEILARLDISAIRSQGYSFFLESLYRLSECGCRYREMPIHFRDRKAGQSKIPRLEIFRGMSKLLALIAHRCRRGGRKPGVKSAERRVLDSSCTFCDESYLVERFAPRGKKVADVRGYQCTSMDHHSKPRVVACLSCGNQFVPREEVSPNLREIYADVVDETYLEQQGGRHKTFRQVYRRLAAKCEGTPGRLLEIGSYCGLFLEEARRHGWEVKGVEPSRWAARYAREEKDLDIHCGTIDDGEFVSEEKSYDAIVLWDVLEHIEDPVSLLAGLHRMLKDDGVLCLSTLDIDNWFPRLAGRHWPWLMNMHVCYFSVATLADCSRRAGFRLVEAEPYCHYISVRYFLDKAASLLPLGLGRLLQLFRPLCPRSICIPFRFGDIKLYTCRKVGAPQTAAAVAGTPASGKLKLNRA